MLDVILGLMIFAIIGIAIIAPIVALILYWFTKITFLKGWIITSIVVLIIISLMTAMVFIGEAEGSFSLSYRHAVIAVGISVSAIIICLYLIFKKPFKKKWATTILYIIGFL